MLTSGRIDVISSGSLLGLYYWILKNFYGESDTLPVNLNVNNLAVSRTVKEVLDTLCLMKQINRDTVDKYEYSLQEVDTKFYDLKKWEELGYLRLKQK